MGSLNLRVNEKWLDDVKMYGNNPKKLLNKIVKNKVKNNCIVPGLIILPRTLSISDIKYE